MRAGRITDYDVIFLYGANADYGGGNNEYRDIVMAERADCAVYEEGNETSQVRH